MLNFDWSAWPPGALLAAATVLVLVVDWVAPLPYTISPAHFFYKLAYGFKRQLAGKANNGQLRLYGTLSLLVYFAIIGTLVFALLFIAPSDIITQAALFYLALGYQDVAKSLRHANQLLANGQKSAAKSQLAPLSQYDVKPLSELGVNKLINETLVVRFFALWVMPAFLFIVANGLVALLYRALYEAARCWSHDGAYSTSVRAISNLIELIPAWFLAPFYSVFKLSVGWRKAYKEHKKTWVENSLNSNNQLIWLAIAAIGCKAEFAGPVKINDQKYARPRLNKGAPVTSETTLYLLNWHNRFRFTFIVLITITGVLLWALT